MTSLLALLQRAGCITGSGVSVAACRHITVQEGLLILPSRLFLAGSSASCISEGLMRALPAAAHLARWVWSLCMVCFHVA